MQSISRDTTTKAAHAAREFIGDRNIDQLRKPTLSLGSTHPDVAELQSLLSLYVNHVTFSNSFDESTDYSVRVFQYRMFLPEDGIVGPQTWLALFTGAPVNKPIVSIGSLGPEVKQVQEVLSITSFLGIRGIDGVFGSNTERAVFNFQRRFGLIADSIVGPSTWHALSKARLEDPTLPVKAFRPLANHRRHQNKITSIAVTNRNDIGERIATGSTDTTVRLWEVFGEPVDPPYVGDRGAVSSVAFHPSRPQVLSGTFGGTVRTANMPFSPSAPLTAFPARGGSVSDLAIDPTGRYIVTANGDKSVRFFNFEGDLIRELGRADNSSFSNLREVVMNPRGEQIAIASLVGGVRVWENPLDPQGRVKTLPNLNSAAAVSFSPHGYKIAAAIGTTLHIYGTHYQPQITQTFPAGITALAFSGSGRYLAVGCLDSKVYMLDVQADQGLGKIVFTLRGHEAPISAVAFGGLPQVYFYSADERGTLRTWNILYDVPSLRR